jgi:hypothetical protein
MSHPSSLGTFFRRYRLVSLLLALLLACGALFSLGERAYAAQQAPTQAAIPATTNSAVTYANGHWNWTYYDPHHHSTVPQGAAQPNFQCAEFVARSLAYEGFIPGLSSNSSQRAYEYYRPGNGKTYDLLLITPLPGYHTLADFLLTFGYFRNVGHNVGNAEPGDMVVFADGGIPQHIVLIVSSHFSVSTIRIDAHNNAAHNYPLSGEIAGFGSWYILHIV